MWLVVVIAVVIALAVGLLVWRRRGTTGVEGGDPQAHRNIGGSGPPNQSGSTTSGGGGFGL